MFNFLPYKGLCMRVGRKRFLFSGNFSVTFSGGILYRDGNGFLYKIREQSSVCTAVDTRRQYKRNGKK